MISVENGVKHFETTRNILPEKQLCSICGEQHSSRECNLVRITNHISDKHIPSKARLTLPDFLEVKKLSDGTNEVYTKTVIKQGTEFGPFQARKLFTLNPCIQFPLKIFLSNEDDFSEYFLDTSDEQECSWMFFISAASELEEQNLICYQENNNIFYCTIKDIAIGESLKVWYSPHYASKMKKKILEPIQVCGSLPVADVNLLVQEQQKIKPREMWNCKFCSNIESNVVVFAKHLLDHYKAQMRRTCDLCKEVLGSRKVLKKHLRIVHPNKLVLPIGNNKNDNSVTKLPDSNTSVGGPLLNDILSDSLDNSTLLLQQTDLNQLNILLENDALSTDNLLNENVKALDHFNFELNDAEEQIICDICLKKFVKVPSLIQHLKQHTGQFHCLQCNKIFCRRENLLGHACTKYQSLQCNFCDKVFFQKKYLKQHISGKHDKQFKCDDCGKCFGSNSEFKLHNCAKVLDSEKKQFVCNICGKMFYRDKYLKQHLRRIHDTANKIKIDFICEICCNMYTSRRSLVNHMKVAHEEPKLKCDVCGKMFHRRHLLNNHMLTHTNDKKYTIECPVCKKLMKCKKTLAVHMNSHSDENKFECKTCNAKFKFRASLLKHVKSKHTMKKTNIKDIEYEIYDCPKCNKKMKLKSSLSRHIKRLHPEYHADFYLHSVKPKKVKLRPTPKLVDTKAELDRRNHLNIMETIENMDFSDITPGNEDGDNCIEEMLNKNIDNFLEENFPDDSTNKIQSASKEVCLSMPDLTESDQEIKLGKNAYILDNGTIVEPQENSDKVVIYFLGQKF